MRARSTTFNEMAKRCGRDRDECFARLGNRFFKVAIKRRLFGSVDNSSFHDVFLFMRDLMCNMHINGDRISVNKNSAKYT